MTIIRFFVNGYDYAYAQIEVEPDEFYPIPHIGEEISSLADEIIVIYPPNSDAMVEQKELEKNDFDFYHVENVTYSLGGNNEEDSGNLVDIMLEGDYYDFD